MIIALTKNWISSGVIFEIGIAFKNFSKKLVKCGKGKNEKLNQNLTKGRCLYH